MKRFIPLIFVASAFASMTWASTPDDTTVKEIRALTRSQAEQHRPVVFEATVTNVRPQSQNLFVQDGDQGIYVTGAGHQKLAPGDHVRIKGTTTWGYRANIDSHEITILGHGSLPIGAPAQFVDLTRGQFDAQLVTVQGTVRSADLRSPRESGPPTAILNVLTQGGHIEAEVQSRDADALKHLLDSQVAITGVSGGRFDGKMELTGILLHVNGLADVKVIKPAVVNPWSLPLTGADDILRYSKVDDQTSRVRVAGTVTYFEPGVAVVLQNSERSLWIKTGSYGPVSIGDQAQAIGFPGTEKGFLVLTNAEIQDTGVTGSIQPEHLNRGELHSSKHIYDLVSIEGKVVTQTRVRSQDEYVVLAGGQMFSIIFPHRGPLGSLPAFKDIPAGSRIRATGICVNDNASSSDTDVPFNLLIRSTDDIALIAKPSLLTEHNLTLFALALLFALLVVGARALWVGRKMRSQVAELGYLSQRRGEILEEINRSRPLTGILERITELGSLSLKGAPCWCKVGDGPTLGNCPDDFSTTGLRVIQVPIEAHSGDDLGLIFAAFDSRTEPRVEEHKALVAAAALATLAIETARMHSDLVHRSEFDMLTEIQNRFAFEKRLQMLIEDGRKSAGIFALIYIDLNDFKQVNDRFGHQAGDLYLQKVAERMKHQLRSCDLLARLGGDEFGVLVPILHSRGDAEAIVRRLESCFDEPFAIKSHIVSGSASIGIAIYPADGLNEDALMSVADSAMYGRKRNKQSRAKAPVEK